MTSTFQQHGDATADNVQVHDTVYEALTREHIIRNNQKVGKK